MGKTSNSVNKIGKKQRTILEKQEYPTLITSVMLLLFYYLLGFVEGGTSRAAKIKGKVIIDYR